ncbi:hypothetical protein JR334_01725 [Clostridia bacterium]|nr:hypothetical protein JR334_01725 [Clostridia bacterium]
MRSKSKIIVLCLLLLLSGCTGTTDDAPIEEEASNDLSAPIEEKQALEYGQIPYVSNMLDEWLLSLKNDDLQAGLSYFADGCEGRLIGDDIVEVREPAFWRSYLSNMMNFYVDATIEVENVELNGRGSEGEVVFILEIKGIKADDDYVRRIMADVIYIDEGWKFSRFEELGDKI